jgi:MFS family permease
MSMGILTATFGDPAVRARVLGLWSGTFGAGMAAGPALGGLLAAAWGWRSLFWITILPGLSAWCRPPGGRSALGTPGGWRHRNLNK